MAITSLDGYIAAAKQRIRLQKNAGTSVAAQWHTLFDRGGQPGAGSLSIANTTTGVVPADATAGCPTINAFGGGNTGYPLARDVQQHGRGAFLPADRLFHAGSVSATANATTSLSTQPSYVGRLPGSSYAGLDLWGGDQRDGQQQRVQRLDRVSQPGELRRHERHGFDSELRHGSPRADPAECRRHRDQADQFHHHQRHQRDHGQRERNCRAPALPRRSRADGKRWRRARDRSRGPCAGLRRLRAMARVRSG